MTLDTKAQFLYLNREDRWLDFEQRRLELQDGKMRLASLPLFETTFTEELVQLPSPNGPAGLAIGNDETIYFTDPGRHLLLRINPCSGETSATPCLGGYGSQVTSFSTPRGLLFDPRRQALFVADSGNHRLQIFNTESFQLVEVWGQEDPAADPQPSSEPGSFDTPWTLAADSEGNVYVAEAGNHRVQKFDRLGRVNKNFWYQAGEALGGAWPSQVAIGNIDGHESVFILAAAAGKLFILDTGGYLLRTVKSEEFKHATGMAVSDAIYVGDNARRRILKFSLDGALIGEARGYNGPVAALAIHDGELLVHTGSVEPGILHLSLTAAYARKGFMWGGPFGTSNPRLKEWFSLKATPDQLPHDAHLRLFTFTTDGIKPPEVEPETDEPFAGPGWKAMPFDITDGLIGGVATARIWVGVEFSGEGLTTPTISQLSLEYDHEGYLPYFPAIYRDDPIKRALLEKFLALYESFFGDTEQLISSLSALFDSQSAPLEFLDWLAGWLALDLDERWSEEKKRRALTIAFDLYGRRGTPAGLRDALQFFAGVQAHIEEPIMHSSWWALPADDEGDETEGAMLGFNTTLAPEEAQGAIVGTTATYDESSLITIDEFGAPLFSSVAHRFVVRLQKSQAGGATRQKELEAIIEREKPAHTLAHVCLVEPGLTLGFQALIGIDSVLGGEPPLARLDQSELSLTLQLGGDPAGRVGEQSRLGQTTRLGDVRPGGRLSKSEKRQAHEAKPRKNRP
ncbi:MAG TPA: phage tail protein [Pyrinomonadaceae bacterium]|nr:phage tail protein [Pyrinomonadaceae bacterium]